MNVHAQECTPAPSDFISNQITVVAMKMGITNC